MARWIYIIVFGILCGPAVFPAKWAVAIWEKRGGNPHHTEASHSLYFVLLVLFSLTFWMAVWILGFVLFGR